MEFTAASPSYDKGAISSTGRPTPDGCGSTVEVATTNDTRWSNEGGLRPGVATGSDPTSSIAASTLSKQSAIATVKSRITGIPSIREVAQPTATLLHRKALAVSNTTSVQF